MTALFSRLYIACQTRDGNLELLFKQENHSCPPSIFQLRQGKQYDILECLTGYYEIPNDIPDADVIVLAGAVVANMMKPITCKRV